MQDAVRELHGEGAAEHTHVRIALELVCDVAHHGPKCMQIVGAEAAHDGDRGNLILLRMAHRRRGCTQRSRASKTLTGRLHLHVVFRSGYEMLHARVIRREYVTDQLNSASMRRASWSKSSQRRFRIESMLTDWTVTLRCA
jgi:hypothetical protein